MPAASRPAWILPAAFILLGLIWGSSFAWIKIAVEEIPPATLVAWRMTLGAIGMVAMLAILRGVSMPRGLGEWLPLVVMGAVNAAIPIFLISWGEQFVDSGTAAVLNSLVPIFSLIIAGLMLRTEPVTALEHRDVIALPFQFRKDAAGLQAIAESAKSANQCRLSWLRVLRVIVPSVRGIPFR